MPKFVPGLFAAVLVIGLGSVPTLAYAEEDATEGGGATSGEDSAKEEPMTRSMLTSKTATNRKTTSL